MADERGTAEQGRRARDWLYGNRSNWLRGLLMLGFFILLGLIKVLVGFMALFQFGSLLITGQPNERLARFGTGLAAYTGELIEYLTCSGERLPFPFSDWPASHR
jgi:hypothetical protein